MGEGLERINREYCVEALLEGLELHLYCFVEGVVQNKINVLLGVFKGHIDVGTVINKLNMIKAWHRKVKHKLFYFATIG